MTLDKIIFASCGIISSEDKTKLIPRYMINNICYYAGGCSYQKQDYGNRDDIICLYEVLKNAK